MVDLWSPDFVSLLSSFSNEISLKILKSCEENRDGLNLTDTSRYIKEKTSTVKDHLVKLMDSNLVYLNKKKYFLSYLGMLILEQITNIAVLNNTRKIFGNVSNEVIPIKFIIKIVPYLKGARICFNQWTFMSVGNKIIDIIKNNVEDKKFELKLIGWNSVPIALEITRSFFSNARGENDVMKKFVVDTNLKLITDNSFLNNIEVNGQLEDLFIIPEIKERILVCQKIERFNFMIIRYDKYLTFFLSPSQEAGLGPYFIIRSKPKDKSRILDIFEEIYEYFSNKATPLSDILKK